MKAVVFDRHGGPEVLQYTDIDVPRPGPNDVLIRVKASGANYNDIWARRGMPGQSVIFPHVSGSDAAGIVEEVGSEVSHVSPGDEVMVHPSQSCRICEACTRGEEFLCRRYRVWGNERLGAFQRALGRAASRRGVRVRHMYTEGDPAPRHLRVRGA